MKHNLFSKLTGPKRFVFHAPPLRPPPKRPLVPQGKPKTWEEAIHPYVEQAPQSYTCPYEGLGILYLRQGRTDEAEQMLEQAIAVNPRIEYRKYDALAGIRIEEGRLDEAEALLERSLRNHPGGTEAARLQLEIQRRRAGQ